MQQTLEYATPGTEESRVSRLSVTSLIVSVIAYPSLSVAIVSPLTSLINAQIDFLIAPLGMIGLAVLLASVALVRINRSGGRLEGRDNVFFAFTFCGLWWTLYVAGWWVFH